jgi:exopolyphosphatase / guanosine-5'-triphosphate,3'-diphosphate pyrophosphatase
MRIAAIDLGSNSFHMVIVEVGASGAFQVIGREKEMVRLGASTLSRGRLPATAMRRGLEALVKYRRLARTQAVDKMLAVATAAIREASNGEEFLHRVGRATGIWPKAISGDEEGRLIYLAALHSVHLEGRRALVVDIGGGSVELVLGAGSRLEDVASEKLGVIRMTEAFVHSDPLSSKDEARLVSHIDAVLAAGGGRLRESGHDSAIGTSGTVLALGALALHMTQGSPPESLHHVVVKAEAIHALRKRLVQSDLRARLKMPGMDEHRADIIVAGAVVLDTILNRLGVAELTLCEWSLREGILLDYIHGHPRSLARAEAYPDVRRRSVVALGERCAYDEGHARHTAALATSLFDQTRTLHGLGEAERALLEYASLLHDIGRHISYPGHHKHSYYLIKNGDLMGFDPVEIEVIANVARYHRRGHPRKKHASYAGLPKEWRRAVRLLGGFLRVADALDRSHRRVVRGVKVSLRTGTLRIACDTSGNSDLEMWGAPRRKALLEKALGAVVRVDVAASPGATTAAGQRLRAGRG